MPAVGASPLPSCMKARCIWFFCRLPPMSRRSYLPLPIVRAFIRSMQTTMPSADFCVTVRKPHDPLSCTSATRRRSPEVSLASFNARPPDLQPCRLMDMDFMVLCPLVPSGLPQIRFFYIGPHFRYGFLQTPPHGDALASRLPFTSIRLGGGLAPPSCQTCSAHTSQPLPAAQRRSPNWPGVSRQDQPWSSSCRTSLPKRISRPR